VARASLISRRRRRRPRLTLLRLTGWDRRGPEPPATRAGAPLHPWTLPNAIGFLRLGLLPLYLAEARRRRGRGRRATWLYVAIAAGDYADGIAARVTGQYSRLGALMDPVTDRLLIISGVGVALAYDLLPRRALVAMVLRETVQLGLARYGLARGVDVRINWPGRLAVFPAMISLGLGMLGRRRAGTVLLWIGLAMAICATALYARAGWRARA
jgi:cardiolipin synthase